MLEEVYRRCKRRPGHINYVLYQKVDRYFRNTEIAWRWIKKFKEIDVEVNFIEQWIPFGAGGDRLMLNIRLGLAEEESGNTSRRTKQNLNSIKQKGYYVGSLPPKGFRKIVLPNYRKSLEPDGTDTLAVIQHIFRSYLYGNVNRSFFVELSAQIGLSRSKFYELFKNPTYAGLNKVTVDGKVEYIRADWIEHAIITPEEFEVLQCKIQKQIKATSRTVVQSEKFWLKGHIFDLKGNRMSASTSKGRNRYYSYYQPTVKGGKNVPVKLAHDLVIQLFGKIKLKKGIVHYLEGVMRKQLNKENQTRKNKEAIINRDIKQIDLRLKELNRQFAIGEIELGEYRELKEIVEDQKEQRLISLEKIDSQKFINERVILEAIKIIPNLKNMIKSGNQEIRTIILNTFFPDGIFVDLEKRRVGTVHLNEMVSQLIDVEGLTKVLILRKEQFFQTVPLRVKDGIRTRGPRNHKPVL